LSSLGSTDEKREYTGSNGTFVDHCEGGNLVDYSCEIGTMTANGQAFPYQTGAVVSQEFDCDGRCQDGACPDVCPQVEDVMRYESLTADGIHGLTNLSSGWSYQCELFNSWQDYDCEGIEPGTELTVILAPSPSSCPTVAYGLLGLGAGTQSYCGYYDCVLMEP
jgi:hypothetical protein